MFNQYVHLVLFISLGLISTLSINSPGMNNTLNDISFRQHVEVTMVMEKVFSEHKTSTMLDILVSRGKQSHISCSIHSMNSHLCPMHVSNSAVFFRTSKRWQLYWVSWQMYKSVNTHFQSLVFLFVLFSISWNPYFQQVHRISNPNAKVKVLHEGSAPVPFVNYCCAVNYIWHFLVQCFITLPLSLCISLRF